METSKAVYSEESSSRRRTSNQDPWNQLDDVITERVLAQLPVADFFRCQFVCRRWRSVIHSPTFLITSHELFNHRPWFFMLESQSLANVVFDMEVEDWRHARLPVPTDVNGRPRSPVAASGGLMCFKSETGVFIVCNPLTGSARSLPRLETHQYTKAIAMHALGSSYKVFVIFGKSPSLNMEVFSSVDNAWMELPVRKISMTANHAQAAGNNGDILPMQARPRISVIEWTPMKELAAVTTVDGTGQVMVYYLSPSGRLVGCDTHQGTAWMYPRLLPQGKEYAIDLVECDGRILIVVLMEGFETATVRVWEFDHGAFQWKHLAAMPPDMSHIYHGMEADINCAGRGDNVVVCVSSEMEEFHQVVMYKIGEDSWVELPWCFDNRSGRVMRFMSVYSFEPDIKAEV